MTRAEQTIYARMMEIREVVRSGATEMVGKTYRGASGKIEGRYRGGMSKAFPELERAGLTPGEAAKAIESKRKGKRFKRLYRAIADEYGLSTRKRGRGRLVVPRHKGNRRCKHCRQMHSTSEHRFHGPGSFNQTHLFSFNPMDEFKIPSGWEHEYKRFERMSSDALKQEYLDLQKGVFDRVFGNNARIAKNIVGHILRERGYYSIDNRPFGSIHIRENPRKKKRNSFQKNPHAVVVIYGRVLAIEAMKTQKHLCDAECKRFGHRYRHDFKPGAVMYGLSDGSILIQGD